MRAVHRLALALGLSVVASPAWATPPLYTPFPCGSTYTVTQGHNTGSHTAQGAWAWDIGIGVGGEVAAPADGVIRMIRMDSTTGGCSNAYANDANYVVVDFGDGTEALFLHLQANSTSLQVGQAVKQGDVVGKVGLTGWVCGAHLHFQIQNTCASWWCQSIPATFVDFGDPGYGATMMSNNCPPLDPCDALAGGQTIVDERTTCFEQQTSYWWSVYEGYDDHHYFTYAIDAAESDTVGTWWLEVEVAGRYAVEAHVPPGATSTGARYFADPGSGRTELAVIDQSSLTGWVALGELDFALGSDRYVELGDATGESSELSRMVAFDALRFTYLPEGEGGGLPAGGGEPASGVGGAGVGGASSGVGGDPSGVPASEEDAGCGCRLAGKRGPADGVAATSLAWLAIAFLARRRRTA
jgi:hypothetical protein